MDEQPKRIVEFGRLNLLGKAIYAGGAIVRFTANTIDTAIDRATDVIAEAERAFKQGRDPNIEDARILEEEIEPPRRRRSASHSDDD